MRRPTGFAELAGRRVGVFGYGVEGRASARRLASVAASLVIVDDEPVSDEVMVTSAGGLAALATCEVVLKSPGIPRRRADVLELEAAGVIVTSSLNLWLHEAPRERVIAVTGTKGKSTTTSLISFFLDSLGQEAASLGNIGRPPYDPEAPSPAGWLVLEVSSFQAVDLDRAPAFVVVTSLGSDHLDWHGSLEQYWADKLSLTRARGEHHTYVTPSVLSLAADQLGGEIHVVEPDDAGLAERLGLLGQHNRSNVALALTVVANVLRRDHGDVLAAVSEDAESFVPLRGRLTLLGEEHLTHGRLRYVDDGLATAPLPTIAALEVFPNESLALIAGGFDRGVDYAPLVDALLERTSPTILITMGAAGERLGSLARQSGLRVRSVQDMAEAVAAAREALVAGGVVLFSPAAPSFDRYRNWLERSDDYAAQIRTSAS